MGETPKNRLLNVRTNVILSRWALKVPEPSGSQLVSSVAAYRKLFQGTAGVPLVKPADWTAEERAALEAVSVAMTPEEHSDVALIDSFFLVGKTGVLPVWLNLKPWEFFDLDPWVKWQDQRLVAKNAKVLTDTIGTYPIPSPLSAGPGIWYRVAQGKLSEAARYKWPLDPQVARFMITLIVLATYEQASNEIMDYFEDKARKDKRRAIINAIALAVFSLIMPAIAAAGFGAIMAVLDAKKAREAAKEMIAASKQFEATDAEFSSEITSAAEIIDYQAAQEQAATSLTQAEEDAIREHGQEGEITPEEVEAAKGKKPKIAELLVGGGVAAGLVALLLLR